MRGVNKAIIVGNVGKDPEVKVMSSGDSVVNFTVATSEQWKDKQGAKQESTEWHRVVIFGKLADIASQYLTKGSKVYIEGQIKTRKWQKDGIDMYTTEIVAKEMQMLGGNSEGQPQRQASASAAPAPADFDDDIPFN